jgi:hypothetical protein
MNSGGTRRICGITGRAHRFGGDFPVVDMFVPISGNSRNGRRVVRSVVRKSAHLNPVETAEARPVRIRGRDTAATNGKGHWLHSWAMPKEETLALAPGKL